MTAPPMSVPKPPMFLVRLWATRSAPRVSGRWQKGVAKVLSTMMSSRSFSWRGLLRGSTSRRAGGGDDLAQRLGFAQVAPAGVDAVAGEPAGEQAVGGAVELLVGQDLVALADDHAEGGGDGGHAGGGGDGELRPLGRRPG